MSKTTDKIHILLWRNPEHARCMCGEWADDGETKEIIKSYNTHKNNA